ncbi:hypothetical protein LAZ67_1004422 [Cordylochernes scorpioides]|uniref:General transcription factor II-I repeat domain-containing protein 2 n=1 Tax=Cordylochernes scorpioides TaxID=51811 RepID=A0ABY6JXF4_9ARAC|nr:hypothetical protein LAZ67_1004422 [Cordylochernes scorpioides]
MFTKVSQESEAAVHASYVLSEMIAKHSKPFTEGDFIKECLIKAAEIVCPGSVKTFQAISLSRNTVVERVTDMARNLNDQIKEKSSCFEAFSIACDESADIGGVAQLSVFFFRACDTDFNIFEELLELVLKQFWDLKEEICQFLITKNQDITLFSDQVWLQEFSFMVDITKHLSDLNLKLQGKDQIITNMCDQVNAFKCKLVFWEKQLKNEDLMQFPTCNMYKSSLGETASYQKYAEKILSLRNEFETRFSDFKSLEGKFTLFSLIFSINIESVPNHMQMEVIDIQYDSDLKAKFIEVGVSEFYKYLPARFENTRKLAYEIMSMFGSTYRCEQLFSLMKGNKSPIRSRITDVHLGYRDRARYRDPRAGVGTGDHVRYGELMTLERKRSTRSQPPTSKCKTCCRRVVAFLFSHVGLCALVVGYSVLGALAFRQLESRSEQESGYHLKALRRDTVAKLWNITMNLNVLYPKNWTEMVSIEIQRFQSEVIARVKDGYDGKELSESSGQWSFSGAFLYSLTVITTIGEYACRRHTLRKLRHHNCIFTHSCLPEATPSIPS